MDLSESDSATCPYCELKFQNKEELSIHIDRFHHSSELMRAILGYPIFGS